MLVVQGIWWELSEEVPSPAVETVAAFDRRSVGWLGLSWPDRPSDRLHATLSALKEGQVKPWKRLLRPTFSEAASLEAPAIASAWATFAQAERIEILAWPLPSVEGSESLLSALRSGFRGQIAWIIPAAMEGVWEGALADLWLRETSEEKTMPPGIRGASGESPKAEEQESGTPQEAQALAWVAWRRKQRELRPLLLWEGKAEGNVSSALQPYRTEILGIFQPGV